MSSYAVTTRYGFNKINYATPNWQSEEYANQDMLDSILYAIQSGPIPFAVDSSVSANTITMTYAPAITAYTSGLQLSGKVANTNSAATVINVNGLGNKTIKLNGADLPNMTLLAGMYFRVIYDGTNFLLLDPIISTPVIAGVTPTQLSTGHPTWDASKNLTDVNNITTTGTGNFITLQQAGKQAITHAGAYTSGTITVSTAAPSGGNNGDIWFRVP